MKLDASEMNIPTTAVNSGSALQPIVGGVFYLAGAICVIVLIIAGIRYAAAAGNASTIASAKKMITWAVIGLIVVISSFAIVNFLLERV